MMSKLLFESANWDFPTLNRIYAACEEIAVEELQLDTYPNQIEIITADQMLEAYSSHGLPVYYKHWSFGKEYMRESQDYKKGRMGLAYEIVVNTDPCINYLMEENTSTMQALVIAHAAFGHNSFFKGNYLFRQWTDASAIVDYLVYARDYIAECEQKYGVHAVEVTLDACHALSNHGVDKYKRPPKLSKETKKAEIEARQERDRKALNELWYRTVKNDKSEVDKKDIFPERPEENILYFIEKHSPTLETWQREIVRIVRKIAQYFYPQRQTQVGNEGWASFTHHYIMTRLEEKGLISPGNYMEFLASHSSVLTQREGPNFNPYWLGFNMYHDIKRICREPTAEDRAWFPDIAGAPWLPTLKDAMSNYRDESFIRQFLSPKMIRENKMYLVSDKETSDVYKVSEIHNKEGYKRIREVLADSKEINNIFPDIQVVRADLKGDRKLTLVYNMVDDVCLHEGDLDKTLEHLHYLWGYSVELVVKDNGEEKWIDSYPKQELIITPNGFKYNF